MTVGTGLVERDGEAAAIAAAVAGTAVAGGGSVLVIEGVAGIGKSSLVQHAIGAAEEYGLRILRARGQPA
jgi:predicted ATPase